ncbi:hypothetical protein GIB67_038854 [Kingdonia uniflora]|uniref:Uncharacterized protein n=1 Tax=Kingdonia uniflora TaxID=39325 RepID=A0A7J7L1X0_9MAGN|nr:hypothetical protein GIB67_028128 [Kingdonia uniflora]KAF6136534.1 hypothetical protein GIB67_038854 [Kingdonia uniflora]
MTKHQITSRYRRYSSTYQQFEYTRTLLEIASSSTVRRYQSIMWLRAIKDTPPLVNRSYAREHHKIVSSQRMLIDPLQINKYQDVIKIHHEDSSKPDIVTSIINVTNGHIIRLINKTI